MHKDISITCWVHFCCLCVYDFRTQYFVLANQLGNSSLGEANASSLSSHQLLKLLSKGVWLSDTSPFPLAWLLVLPLFRSCSYCYFWDGHFSRLLGILAFTVFYTHLYSDAPWATEAVSVDVTGSTGAEFPTVLLISALCLVVFSVMVSVGNKEKHLWWGSGNCIHL